MIVTDYPHWPRILRQVRGPLLLVVGVSVVVTLLDRHEVGWFKAVSLPDMTVTMLGVALSIPLGFRTTSAYARWWEARTLWGAMVNTTRTLARQAAAFAGEADPAFARRVTRAGVAFAHACRHALRRTDPWPDVTPFLDPAAAARVAGISNVPIAILHEMGRDVADAARRKAVDPWQLQQLDDTLTNLCNVIGGCERIKNTPLPRQYDFYPDLFIKAYCLVLPVVVVDRTGVLTPVLTAVVAFAFLVLNRIGKNLEDPFEDRPYDVPLTALCRTIEVNLRQALGEADVPPPAAPDRGVLW